MTKEPRLKANLLQIPGVQHGAMLQHSMEQLPMMPQLGAEHVSSLLRSSLAAHDRAAHDLPHTVPMEPLLHGLDDHGDYQVILYEDQLKR